MTYKQTLEFLFSQLPAYHRIGRAAYKNNLDNTFALDEYLGHPHMKYKTIHVAGTNGKGSVSHMIASVLQEAGYKTGLYTSPHLKDFRERIKVNGKIIPKREVTTFVKEHREIIDSLKPSFFEMTVAMAFLYFSKENVDVAVIEVGLGGRLDSTNIINPVLSIITNIGHDHMDLLGNTIAKVASEKAGVIKKNIPVVIGETQPDTKDIFISRASETRSEIYFADVNFICSMEDKVSQARECSFFINDLVEHKITSGAIPLGGEYQVKNLQTLFQSFRCLEKIFKFSERNLLDGIKRVVINTGLKGRWQILKRNPLTICDTGHNKEGLEYVMKQISRIPSTGLHIIIGFVSDKDLSSIFPLFPSQAKYYFTKASVPRALDEKILKEKASAFGLEGDSYTTVNKALKSAFSKALSTDLVFVGGSTFVVAEVI
jgi:dihydrofolate synthase/folylpolyglutamate synthase